MLIVDDHQLFIDGIRHVLNRLAPDAVITEANTSFSAIDILESGESFDLVFIDLVIPGMDGLSILKRLHAQGIWYPLVILSGDENVRTIKAALELGALGFIPKSFSSEAMLSALRSILEGELFVPQAISQQLNELKPRRFTQNGNITRRQLQVLELLAQGYTNRQIAATLCLTEHTIKAHVSALFIELNVANRTECVQMAESRGLI
ncbi:response regulator [Marinobacter santoriniensis NKSG1]|uniref:Response regulator n=2 Tax=Marinobacter santoriniensis TaxID=523742 RepID=M7D6R0_9GAMM|nr:response regulator [Marinobacter santoriniensis NKSG1]